MKLGHPILLALESDSSPSPLLVVRTWTTPRSKGTEFRCDSFAGVVEVTDRCVELLCVDLNAHPIWGLPQDVSTKLKTPTTYKVRERVGREYAFSIPRPRGVGTLGRRYTVAAENGLVN